MADDWGYESEHIRGIEFKNSTTRNEFDASIEKIKKESNEETELNELVEGFYKVLRVYNMNENFKVVDNFEVGTSVWDYAEEDK